MVMQIQSTSYRKESEIQAMLVGHGHISVNEIVGATLVGGARDTGRQVVRFDLTLKQDGET